MKVYAVDVTAWESHWIDSMWSCEAWAQNRLEMLTDHTDRDDAPVDEDGNYLSIVEYVVDPEPEA